MASSVFSLGFPGKRREGPELSSPRPGLTLLAGAAWGWWAPWQGVGLGGACEPLWAEPLLGKLRTGEGEARAACEDLLPGSGDTLGIQEATRLNRTSAKVRDRGAHRRAEGGRILGGGAFTPG